MAPSEISQYSYLWAVPGESWTFAELHWIQYSCIAVVCNCIAIVCNLCKCIPYSTNRLLARISVCRFQGLGMDDIAVSSLLPLITNSRGSRLPCCEDTQSSPMEWSKKNWGLLPTVPTCQACKWTILSDSPTPGKPSDDYSPIDILTATSWQTPSQKHSVKPFPNSWPTGVKGDNMFTHFHMSQHIIFSSTI